MEYFPYKNQPHIGSIDSESLDSENSLKSPLQTHKVELNLEESNLNEGQNEQLQAIVSDSFHCFVNPADGKPGLTDLKECKIKIVPGTTPMCKYPYRLTPAMRDETDNSSKLKGTY